MRNLRHAEEYRGGGGCLESIEQWEDRVTKWIGNSEEGLQAYVYYILVTNRITHSSVTGRGENAQLLQPAAWSYVGI